MDFSDDPEKTISDALARLAEQDWCKDGSWMVVITNALANDQIIDTMQLRQVSCQ
jgi:pyruvate kinase